MWDSIGVMFRVMTYMPFLGPEEESWVRPRLDLPCSFRGRISRVVLRRREHEEGEMARRRKHEQERGHGHGHGHEGGSEGVSEGWRERESGHWTYVV